MPIGMIDRFSRCRTPAGIAHNTDGEFRYEFLGAVLNLLGEHTYYTEAFALKIVLSVSTGPIDRIVP